MDKFVIQGPCRLQGKVKIGGAKNASLALMPVTLLAADRFTLTNTPGNRDVATFAQLLNTLGVATRLEGTALHLDSTEVVSFEAPYEHVKKMRASIYVLGPLLARFGKARVSLPGGCNFGPRPVDLHLKGMERLGASISVEQGYIIALADRLVGNRVHFDISSVGATINVMMAAATARGESLLTNAAMEPEVSAVAGMLSAMGAIIEGAGTPSISIQGVESLHGVEYHTMPDRIEAETFMIAAAMTKGDVTIEAIDTSHSVSVIHHLQESGATVEVGNNSVRVAMMDAPKPVDITAMPFPGFPTDSQAQWAAYMTQANGAAKITDTIYPTRFGYVPELIRLGADIELADSTAIVRGGNHLTGATVMSADLRASASLALVGLVAEGTTEVLRIYHLDRGYENLEQKLTDLGANIIRQETQEF